MCLEAFLWLQTFPVKVSTECHSVGSQRKSQGGLGAQACRWLVGVFSFTAAGCSVPMALVRPWEGARLREQSRRAHRLSLSFLHQATRQQTSAGSRQASIFKALNYPDLHTVLPFLLHGS